ncbi:MAG: hypothetical protein WAO83_06810 [Fuerstiella sp.]
MISSRTFSKPLFAIFATVCLCAVAQPGFASCGDYLHTRYNKPTQTSLHDASMSIGSETAPTHADLESNQRLPNRPCNGPACRNGNSPDAPLMPASSELRMPTDPCCNQASTVTNPDNNRHTPPERRVRKADGFPGTIDHPPK